jgi:hypothetical protein
MPFTIIPLSGSTDYRPVKVGATSGTGTLIHTAQASATLSDFVTLTISNTDTVGRPFVVQWGGTTAPDDNAFEGVLLASKSKTICVKKPIRNSLIIRVKSETLTWIDGISYTGAADILIVNGEVQREAA